MSAGFRPRTFLNRSDPRLRGILTWIPMDGHFTNTGDIGGQVPPPPSTGGWQPSPLAGTFWLNDTLATARDAELTPDNVGVNGANPRTVFFEYYHSSVATFSNIFAIGSAVATNAFGCFKANATTLRVSDFNTTLDTTLPVSTGQFVRAVIRYDGTNVTLWTRTYDPVGNSWAEQTASGAFSLATTGLGLGLHLWVAGSTVDSASGLSYLGIVGGYAWTDDETRDFLRDPSKLWSPGPSRARYYDVIAATYNDTISDDVAAGDDASATLTTSAALSDTATGADSLAVTVTARPALSDAVTGADSLSVALTARPAISDAVTGADASAAALTAGATLSDSVTAGDLVAGGQLLVESISDAATAADAMAAAATFGPTFIDAVTAGETLGAAATVVVALVDPVTAADTLALAVTFAAPISDPVTAADAMAGGLIFASTISDAVTAADAGPVTVTFAAPFADALTALDAIDATGGTTVSGGEAEIIVRRRRRKT